MCFSRSQVAEASVELPSLDDAPRCSPWSLDQGLAPAGTAVRADQLLLLDVPAPWPRPIRDHPRLTGLMDAVGEAAIPSRLFASLPVEDRIRLTVFRNVGGQGLRSTYELADVRAIPDAVAAAVEGGESSGMTLVEPAAVRPSVLVCTQGTHDICCGSDGVRLAMDVERQVPGADVFRVSHTGGHRFAPTAMTFPDGRMWAWLDADDVEAIVTGTGDHADLAVRCRGWWGAERGAQQAAEVALFAARGWGTDAIDRGVRGDAPVVKIALGAETVEVDVEPSRTVPTIACRTAGGLPTKQATEFIARLR